MHEHEGRSDPGAVAGPHPREPVAMRSVELREEELVAHKQMVELGEVVLRTTVEEAPGRLEVDAVREDVQVEHVPVGRVVRERSGPYEEGDELIVPIYEEELVVVKRLVLREEVHIRRIATTERRAFEDTLRRERLSIDDPGSTGLVHEIYANDADHHGGKDHAEGVGRPGLLERVVRRAFE